MKLNLSFDPGQWAKPFKNLDWKDIPAWQGLPKWLLVGSAALACAVLWHQLWCVPRLEELKAEQDKETQKKASLAVQYKKAAALPLLRKQSVQAQALLKKLEPLLPANEEIPQLLSAVNRMALNRDLKFDTFQPGLLVSKSGFDEVPVRLSVKGPFLNVAGFVSDVAFQSRMMLFDELKLSIPSVSSAPFKPVTQELMVEGLLVTFRQSGGAP